MASLLPAAIDEFRRKEYWERFFTLRGPKAFEWYGEWADVAPTLHPLLAPDAAVLVVGCGNSELGSHVHDSGVGRVVSIDFAESVIRDMRERNRARRGMEFLVMDALHMDFAPASFDIVIDKATLDALMTQEGSAEVVEQAHAMLSEVARVLRDGGRYVCITLAQEHILRTLLHAFCAAHPGWRTTVRMLPSSVQTELCAFQIDFVKPACGAVRALGAAHAQPLTGGEACVTFPEGASLGAAALGAAALGTRTGTAERAVDAAGALERVQELQRQFVTARRIARVARGVRAHLDLWSAAAEGSDGAGPGPRFSLTVVDAATRGSDEPASCAVLLVPQGREHEFMFAVEEGQLQLADSAGFDRLVLVTLNRGHAFSDLDAVQAELSPSILPVQPPCCKGPVPFLRVGDDIGSRDTRCVLETSATGEMVVEDVTDADGQLARRLVFMSNRNSIQSEARVVERRVLDKRARGAGKAAQRHQQQQGKGRKNGRGGQPAAVAAAPSAPAVATAAAADVAAAVADGHGPMDLVVDHGYLAFEVHRAMVASMAVAPAFAAGGPSRRHVAVVGLGGGALPMFLAQHFAWMEVTAVELDAAVVEVARQHFAFREGPHLRVRVEDGLQFIRDTGSAVHAGQTPALHALMLDVDSKDLAEGVAFPPLPFLEPATLASMHACLAPDGVLVINFTCRAAALRAELLQRVAACFAEVLRIKVPDSANWVLVCLPAARTSAARKMPLWAATEQLQRSATRAWSEEMELGDLVRDVAAVMRHASPVEAAEAAAAAPVAAPGKRSKRRKGRR